MRFFIFLLIAFLSGCAGLTNTSPADLRADEKAFYERKVYDFPFDVFLENAHQASINCDTALTFITSPNKQSATALIQMSGLSASATLLVADAKALENKTEISVWLYYNHQGWHSMAKKYIRNATDPSTCLTK